MVIAFLQVAFAVVPVVQRADHLEGLGPLRPFRFPWQLDQGLRALGDVHDEGDRLSVRRPGQLRRRRRQLGQSGRLASVHPPAVKLGRAVTGGFGQVEHALAIRRPAWRVVVGVAAGDRPVLGAVGLDDPEVRPAAVLLHVHEIADVDDVLAVRGNLRIGGVLQPEHVHQLEAVCRLDIGTRLGDGRQGQEEGQDNGMSTGLHEAALPILN